MTLELEIDVDGCGLAKVINMLQGIDANVENISIGNKGKLEISSNGGGLSEDRLYWEIDKLLSGLTQERGISYYFLKNGSNSVIYAKIV